MKRNYYCLICILAIIIITIDSTSSQEASPSRTVHQTLPPAIWQYRTGRLNQFAGFATPRPLPNNAQFLYSSVWAAWSAWSFCVDNARIRVRACNTVRGFSCLGTNREQKSCDQFGDGKLPAAVAPQDYDAVDPWIADREEAMKQLYPDDQAENDVPAPPSKIADRPEVQPAPSKLIDRKEQVVNKKTTTLLPPPILSRAQAAPLHKVVTDVDIFESSGTDDEKQLQQRSPIPPAANSYYAGASSDSRRQFASNSYHPPGLTPEFLAKLKEKTERTAAFAARLVPTDTDKSTIKTTAKTIKSTEKSPSDEMVKTQLATAINSTTTTTTTTTSTLPQSPPRAKQAPILVNNGSSHKLVYVDGQVYDVVTTASDGDQASNSETASIIVHKVDSANQLPLRLLGEAMSKITDATTKSETLPTTDATLFPNVARQSPAGNTIYDEEYIYVDYGNGTEYDDESKTSTTAVDSNKKPTTKPLLSGEIIADNDGVDTQIIDIATESRSQSHYRFGQIWPPKLIPSRMPTPRERARQSHEIILSASRRISGDVYPPTQPTAKHSGEVGQQVGTDRSSILSGDTIPTRVEQKQQVSGEAAEQELRIGTNTDQALSPFSTGTDQSSESGALSIERGDGGQEMKLDNGSTQKTLDEHPSQVERPLPVIRPAPTEEKSARKQHIIDNVESRIASVHEIAITGGDNLERFAESAQWSDWSDWSSCTCGRQARSRTCEYEIAYLTRGCIGRSYETRECTGGLPCSTTITSTTVKSTEPTTLSQFYTLAPQKAGIGRRTGYAFRPHPLAVARTAFALNNNDDGDTR